MLTLEVIVCSVADAIEAARGGANRLEIVRDLKQGGLTPSFELVQEIRNNVDLPLRVMLRESASFETSGEEEIDRLSAAADRFGTLGVDGFVLGFLKDGEVDVAQTARILACVSHTRATFHHAFENANDKFRALAAIKRLPQVDRVLSHGGRDGTATRAQRLKAYEHAAAPELTMLAGGSIDGDAILTIGRATRIREFHVGRAARAGFLVEGDVRAALVSELTGKLKEI